MAHRALYLANDSRMDSDILEILRSQCADVQVVSAIAQATALIESPSLANDHGSYDLLIVADVSAGGIVLAEYVDSLFSRATSGAPDIPTRHDAPIIVLLDEEGDVIAARKALRLGVAGYILSSDSFVTKRDMLIRLTSRTANHADGGHGVGGYTSNGSHNGNGHGNDNAGSLSAGSLSSLSAGMSGAALGAPLNAQVDEALLNLSRLSQIESAIMSCLSSHTGLPLSARSIVNEVMGRDMEEDKAASLIRPHISRLRSKVEPTPQMPQRLLTVRGKGYMFVC